MPMKIKQMQYIIKYCNNKMFIIYILKHYELQSVAIIITYGIS